MNISQSVMSKLALRVSRLSSVIWAILFSVGLILVRLRRYIGYICTVLWSLFLRGGSLMD